MSKKWKSKIKKQQKAKIIQESMTIETGTSGENIEKNSDIVAEVISKKEKYAPVKKDNFLHDIAQVKRDVKKIVLVFGIIIIVLIGLKIADNRSGVVVKLADHIIKLAR